MDVWGKLFIALIVLPCFFSQVPSGSSGQGTIGYAGMLLNGTDPIEIQKLMMNTSAGPVLERVYEKINRSGVPMEQLNLSVLLRDYTLVVVGSSADGTERALLESGRAAYPAINDAKNADDSEATLAIVESGSYPFVVLIGGPSQNRITGELEKRGYINESEEFYGQFVMRTGETENGSLLFVFSDKRGYANAPKENVRYSPLAAIMPPEYVPPAATLLSLILLSIFGIGGNVMGNKVSEVEQKKRKFGEGSVLVFGLNVAELGALVAAAVVLGISLSWQYLGPSPEFLGWVAINAFLCLLAGLSHEGVHRIFAWLFKLKVEYRFWTAGSAITLVSSYLGNAFSIQGFLLEDIDESVAKWKIGVAKLSAPLFSCAIMVLFAIVNVLMPNQIFQSIYATSGMLAMAEIIPLRGMDGYDIKKWSGFVWFFSFLLVAGCYVFVMFLL